jgi:hypothetical protein
MSYSYEDKIAAMELLRANGFNVSRTVAELRERGVNVCRRTLTTWRGSADVGGALFGSATAAIAAPAAPAPAHPCAEEVSGSIYGFVRDAGAALSVAVREVSRRIAEENVTNSELCSFIAALNDIANSRRSGDEADGDGKAGVLSLIVGMHQNLSAEGAAPAHAP